MDWDDVVVSLITLGLAVAAVAGIAKRRGKTLAWYVAGLILGSALGILVVGWPAGLPLGLGAAGVAPVVKDFVIRKFRGDMPVSGKLPVRQGKIVTRKRE